jgi:hypothetical protein
VIAATADEVPLGRETTGGSQPNEEPSLRIWNKAKASS